MVRALLPQSQQDVASRMAGPQMHSNNFVDRHVGRRINRRRVELNIDIEVVARAINVTSQEMIEYEDGIRRISAIELRTVAKVLQTQIAYFYEGLANPPE